MRQVILSFLALVLIENTFSQGVLSFDFPVAECAEKWVVCPAWDDTTFQFGFVFESKGGITFKLEGSFTLDKEGNFVRIPAEKVNQTVNLQGGYSTVAILPISRYKELNIGKFPTWYDKEMSTSGNVVELYTEAIVLSNRGNYEQANVLFQKVYLLNPDYQNLRLLYAKSLNAAKAHQKAIELLNFALENTPNSYEIFQELSLAKLQTGALLDAESAANTGIKLCAVNEARCQMALNLAIYYFEKKDKKKLDAWIKTASKFAIKGQRHDKQIQNMLSVANAW